MTTLTETTTALDRFPVGTRVHNIGPFSGMKNGYSTEGTVASGDSGDWGPGVVMVRFDGCSQRHTLIPMRQEDLGRL